VRRSSGPFDFYGSGTIIPSVESMSMGDLAFLSSGPSLGGSAVNKTPRESRDRPGGGEAPFSLLGDKVPPV